MYVNRTYRDTLGQKELKSFRVSVKETDLFISLRQDDFKQEIVKQVEKLILTLRHDLEAYIERDNEFKTTLVPHVILPDAPPIVKTMTTAANSAGVGPMASVAGTFSQCVGQELLKVSTEVIVENGGDIFLASTQKRLVSIFAGESPFSNRLAIEILPEKTPLGICTSSGTVGPSLSLGKSDAAVVIASSSAFADAAASTVGNAVQTRDDVEKAIDVAKALPGVLGTLVIKDDKLAVWGDFKLVPIPAGRKN